MERVVGPAAAVPWRRAWARAAAAFYGRDDGVPSRHFRTTAMLPGVLAPALGRLLEGVDDRLGRPRVLDVVDVGAGDGALLEALAERVDPGRVRLTAVDLRPRPAALDRRVAWVRGAAPEVVRATWPAGVVGLVVAHEWLDDVPCDVVAYDGDLRPRLALVGVDGSESTGPGLDDARGCEEVGVDADACRGWLARYAPAPRPGARIEVGRARDDVWTALLSAVSAGTALAVDYTAAAGSDTLVGWRHGRPMRPVPDGSMNITAHVVLESCVDVSRAHPRVSAVDVRTQRAALRDLGADRGPSPTAGGGGDVVERLRELQRANALAVATADPGLGAHRWLQVDVSPACQPPWCTASTLLPSGSRTKAPK